MPTPFANLTHLLYDKSPWNKRLDPWAASTAAGPASVAIRRLPADVRTPHERLAALDSQPPLDGEVLLAYVDDEPWAAISLADGRVVADPFRPSAHAVELLRVRAEHLHEQAAAAERRVAAPALRTRRAAG